MKVMGLTSMAVLGVGSLMITLTLNMILGWSMAAVCPGSDSLCNGIYWQTAVKYLPAWLFIGQLLVVLSLASPFTIHY